MKYRFKATHPKYLDFAIDKISVGQMSGNKLVMDWQVVKAIAKCTGLRTKNKRKITKRWKFVVTEALYRYLDSKEMEKNNE